METLKPIALSFLLMSPAAALACDRGPDSVTNHARNYSFETDANGDNLPDDWTFNGTVSRDTQIVHSGAASLSVTGPASFLIRQENPLTANRFYAYGGHVRTQGVTGPGVRFRYIETGGANNTVTSNYVAGNTGWELSEAGYITAPTHTEGRFEIEINITAGRVWIDDVFLCTHGCGGTGWPLAFAPAHNSLGAPRRGPIAVTFSEVMVSTSFADFFSLREIVSPADDIANNYPNGVNLGGSVSPSSNAQVLSFTPTLPLKSRAWYRASVDGFMRDADGHFMGRTFDGCFQTAMDRAAAQVINDAPGVSVEIPANAMASDGRLDVNAAVAADRVSAANRKLVAHAGDPGRAPVPGTVADLTLFDDAGGAQGALSSPATVHLTYPDADGDGWVDGAAPPIAANTLAVYRLDESRQIWTRLFPSTIDPAARRVSVPTKSFGVFALIGQTETNLDAATAFPVPFRAGHGHDRITFANLGRGTRVRIYTPQGELVRELNGPTDASQLDWDVTNGEGTPVASGVYYYRLESGSNSKEGKLVIVR